MTVYSLLFYLFGGIILASAVVAATRQNPLHAVCALVVTFLATAALFVLLGAPLPAILTVLVYAGAIMVLFLFIIMLLGIKSPGGGITLGRLVLPGLLALVALAAGAHVLAHDPGNKAVLAVASAAPGLVGRALFSTWWLAVEAVSVLLFAALVGTLLLGRGRARTGADRRAP